MILKVVLVALAVLALVDRTSADLSCVERGILASSNQVTLSASSTKPSKKGKYHGPKNSRLDTPETEKHSSAWSARGTEVGEYLQADLGTVYRIRGVATQGRSARNQWIKLYRLKYSMDGDNWQDFRERDASKPKVFLANKDGTTIMRHKIAPVDSFLARYVRLYPVAWAKRISTRWELYGCTPCYNNAILATSPYIALSASSTFDDTLSPAAMARYYGVGNSLLDTQETLDHTSAWSAARNRKDEYIQVDLGQVYKVKAIATKGRDAALGLHQRITSYYLGYSNDGKSWKNYENKKVFVGNLLSAAVMKHTLKPLIKARYIRLYALSWHGHISTQWEIYGCPDLNRNNLSKREGLGEILDSAVSQRGDLPDEEQETTERADDSILKLLTDLLQKSHTDNGASDGQSST